MLYGSIQPCLIRKCLPAIFLFCILLYRGVGWSQDAPASQHPAVDRGNLATLHGRVMDSSQVKPCALAVIAILGPDSSLIAFVRSRKDGSFLIRGLKKGGYRILVTHPSYASHTSTVLVGDEANIDLGIITPPPRTQDLEAVVVRPRALPPKMNGDTLEYNTANVKTRINANVEELLNRLPGVQVDQNGVITVNGKKIDRLLVDGEDLFGGDPTIVTRNFNADMIAKVQVLDRKSDQAQFTGIDDGQTTKTLNLTLKPDSKKGYFVKGEAGGAPDGYYNANGLLGSFKGSQQFAALGMASNTGTTGFSGAVGDLGAGMNIGGGTNDALGASAGTGIPRVLGIGSHYADKWNGSHDHVVGNYHYGQLVTHPYSSSLVRQTLPDSIYVQSQYNQSDNSQEQHALNADFDFQPDSLSAFRFSVGGFNMQGHNILSDSSSSSFNDTLVNDSRRAIQSDVDNSSFRSSIMWRRQGAIKKRRVFSIVTGIAKQDNDTKGYLYSLNHYYQPNGSLLRADTTDQRKEFVANAFYINSSVNYTEPLWKDAALAFSYGISFNRTQSVQSTFNRGSGKYDDYVDSLSNHYRNDVLTQRATLNLQTVDKTLGYTLGLDIQHDAYKQQDLLRDSLLRFHYLNFSPRLNLRYNMDPYKGFTFDYNGGTQQPSIAQLQPVQNNNDPLHITLGNPDLHPSFSHRFALGFHDLKPLVINLGLNFGFTTNGISTKTYTDSLGRQVSQAVNTGGSYNGGMYFSVNRRLKGLDMDLGLNANTDFGRNVNYVNQYLSKNDNVNSGLGLVLRKFVPEKYDISLNSNVNYSYSKSSINPGAALGYWTQAESGSATVFFLHGFDFNVNWYYSWRQKINSFDRQNSSFAMNMALTRNLLQNRLTLRLQGFHLFSENLGLTRTISQNQTSENSYNVIGRYWLLSAAYRFVHHRKAD